MDEFYHQYQYSGTEHVHSPILSGPSVGWRGSLDYEVANQRYEMTAGPYSFLDVPAPPILFNEVDVLGNAHLPPYPPTYMAGNQGAAQVRRKSLPVGPSRPVVRLSSKGNRSMSLDDRQQRRRVRFKEPQHAQEQTQVSLTGIGLLKRDCNRRRFGWSRISVHPRPPISPAGCRRPYTDHKVRTGDLYLRSTSQP